jgi:hypothetical protein
MREDMLVGAYRLWPGIAGLDGQDGREFVAYCDGACSTAGSAISPRMRT